MGTLTINNAACNVAIYPVEYGLYYNSYVIYDLRNLANTGWHVATRDEVITLYTYLGGTSIAGGKCKETGTTYWNSPNTGAANSAAFNGRGAGIRNNAGVFDLIKGYANFWTSSPYFGGQPYIYSLTYSNSNLLIPGTQDAKTGLSVRLMKDTTTLSNGQTGTYKGNDGKVYRTICIGTQEWLADNLSETRFRNGDTIPWYGSNPANYFTNAEWVALSTSGCCAFDNNVNNVAPGFSFPT